MRCPLPFLIALLFLGCSSVDRPESISRPDVRLRQSGSVFFGSGKTAPLRLEIDIANRSSDALTVRSVRLQSAGMVQYDIEPFTMSFQDSIAPGETKSFSLLATAVSAGDRRSPTEPLAIRATIQFESGEARFVESYLLGADR